jgi:hypothetical protein
MTTRIHVTVAFIAAGAAFAVVLQARAGGDKVAFPEDYAKGVLFATVDRPDNKQYRELYTSAAAIAAAKKGEPLPSGTVITLVQYAAKLDPQGNPEKDANGRFIKANLLGYTVMEKRTGGAPSTRTMCATANGSIRPSRLTRHPIPAPISPPASTATSRSTSRTSYSPTTN